MFATLHLYLVNPIFEEEFITSWRTLLHCLKRDAYVHSGALHRESRISYISYTTWHSRHFFEEIHKDERGRFHAEISNLRSCCNDLKLLHRMVVISEYPLPLI